MAGGIVAVSAASILTQLLSLTTVQFLQLWTETILLTVLGFFMMISALLANGQDDLSRLVSTPLGALSSFIALVDTVVLASMIAGLSAGANAFGPSFAQKDLFVGIFTVMVVATGVVGFPLGLTGSLRLFHEDRQSE